jgi:hypothetical protein
MKGILIFIMMMTMLVLQGESLSLIRYISPPKVKLLIYCNYAEQMTCDNSYEHVCGYKRHFPRKIYKSPCHACKSSKVFAYSKGYCD